MTVYAISTRYPGEDEAISMDETEEAVAIALDVRNLLSSLRRHAMEAE